MLYPDYIFKGEHYPLPAYRSALSQAVTIVQMGFLILSLGAGRIEFVRTHPLYHKFEEHRIMYSLGIYFGLNMLQNSISSTGAFEVYMNNELIFSKL